jgi:hypothetical protein
MPTHATLVDRRLLASVGFTDHAVQRFAQRAGLGDARRGVVEPIMRDLLLQEGRVVVERPRWARSRNAADLYLQVGEWMLFVCRGSRRRLGSFDVVTVINGREGTSWDVALGRGFVATPVPLRAMPPRRRRVGWWASVAEGLRRRRASEERIGVLRAVLAARRERRRAVRAEHDAALAAYDAARRDYAEARVRAHEAHVRRYG